MPNTGRRAASRQTWRPGSLKHAITKALAALSLLHHPAQRQRDLFHVLLALDAERPLGESGAADRRPLGEAQRRKRGIEAGRDGWVRIRIDDEDVRAHHARVFPRVMLSQYIALQDGRMSSKPYDLVLRGGTVATSSAVFPADVAIDGETIAAVGRDLPLGVKEIDARGKLVLPGGVDSHAHIEQVSAAGILNADTFESATVSAAFGGTTTVISFAAQHIGLRLDEVVDAYHALAKKGAVIDYAFHMIIADPTEATSRSTSRSSSRPVMPPSRCS
jgi:hypothetical protein